MNDVLRLDKWIWFSRISKTRSFAQSLCHQGCIKINSVLVNKPNKPVRIGDSITINYLDKNFEIKVLSLAKKRQSAKEAEKMYKPNLPIKVIIKKTYSYF